MAEFTVLLMEVRSVSLYLNNMEGRNWFLKRKKKIKVKLKKKKSDPFSIAMPIRENLKISNKEFLSTGASLVAQW